METNSSQWHEQTQDEGLCHQISGRNFLRESTQKWDKCSGKVGNNFTFSLDLVMNHLHFKTRPKLRLFVTKFLRESRQKWEKYSCKGIVTINFSLDGRITQIENALNYVVVYFDRSHHLHIQILDLSKISFLSLHELLCFFCNFMYFANMLWLNDFLIWVMLI